jgi:dihydropteroate synthase
VAEVRAELLARVDAAVSAGILRKNIAIDPGIGFAKQADQSRAILRGLPAFTSFGYPVVVGISRKSLIGAIGGEPRADRRLGGSLAAAVFAALRGAAIVRVHDVRDTVQAFRVWHSLSE